MVIFHSYVSLPEGISFNYHMTVYVAGNLHRFGIAILAHRTCMKMSIMYHTISLLILVGGLEPWTFMTFHSVGNVIIPTDQYFSEGLKPPTRIYIYILFIFAGGLPMFASLYP